jgi:hypothetical protein
VGVRELEGLAAGAEWRVQWFTSDWLTGNPDHPGHDAVEADYDRHVRAIRDSLPPGLQLLVEGGGPVSLWDGEFIRTTARGRRQGGVPPWYRDATREDSAGVSVERLLPGEVPGPDLQLDIATDELTDRVYQHGQFEAIVHVHLIYRGYELVEPSSEELYWLARDPATVIRSCEVEVLPDGRFEHRMLLWPTRSPIVIRFDTIDVGVVRFLDGTVEVIAPRPER